MKFNSMKLLAAVMMQVGAFALVASPTLAEGTKDHILASKKVTAGMHNGAPWAYRTPEGNVEGFNAEVIRAVFSPLGVTEFEFITGDFGSLIPGLTANRFDLVDSGMVITPERCKIVAFADPEVATIDALLVHKDNPLNIHSYADIVANPKIKIGGTRGGAQAKNASLAGVPETQLQLFQNTDSVISAIMSGRVDAAPFSSALVKTIVGNPTFSGKLEQAKPFQGLIAKDGKITAGYIGAAFRSTDGDLRDLFNLRLAQLKADGTIKKIMDKYGFTAEEAAPDMTSAQICSD